MSADRQGKKDERQGAMGKRGERRERRDGNLLIGFLSESLIFFKIKKRIENILKIIFKIFFAKILLANRSFAHLT